MAWEIIIAGFFVGMMIGLTGMGGGSLITPVMIFIFGIQPVFAVGTDLVLSALTKTAGAITHLRLKNVDIKITKTLLSGSVPGAILGLLFIRVVSYFKVFSIDAFITHLLGFVLIVVSFGLFYPSIWKFTAKLKVSPDNPGKTSIVRLVSFVVGFAVSLTSVGSGSVFVPFLLATYPLQVSQVVGVDVFHGAILTAVAGAGHLANGTVDFRLLLNLLLGSVPGAVLGSKLSVSFPKRLTEIILGSMLIVSGVKLL